VWQIPQQNESSEEGVGWGGTGRVGTTRGSERGVSWLLLERRHSPVATPQDAPSETRGDVLLEQRCVPALIIRKWDPSSRCHTLPPERCRRVAKVKDEHEPRSVLSSRVRLGVHKVTKGFNHLCKGCVVW
jgi:hypothetical protein